MPIKLLKSKFAFTLAETLITLVIIGVIAAITVPALIATHQKETTVTRLKKMFSALSQTTNKAIADNGPVSTWTLGQNRNANDAKTFLNNYLTPYLSLSEKPTTFAEGNWRDFKNYKELNNSSKSYDSAYVRFYLNDGTSVTSRIDDNSRLIMYVDINGDAKPNKVGRDIFEVNYCIFTSDKCAMPGKFIANAEQQTREQLISASDINNCNKQKAGYRCLALIMKDSWTIAYDYPW